MRGINNRFVAKALGIINKELSVWASVCSSKNSTLKSWKFVGIVLFYKIENAIRNKTGKRN